VGDRDLNIMRELNSDAALTLMIWTYAARLNYSAFMDRDGYAIHDDHVPFLRRGIPAVNVIDFDYPYWHTPHDTPDKVSPRSLEGVGRTLELFLLERGGAERGERTFPGYIWAMVLPLVTVLLWLVYRKRTSPSST